MKKLYFSAMLIFLLSAFATSQTINDSCETALPFCTGMTYNFPAGINTFSQLGPNYGCLYTQPNPAWYYLNILQPGIIEIEMHSIPQVDIDFVVWGPFLHNSSPCSGDLTAGTNTPSHGAPGPSSDYPSGNMIDCSYSTSYQEYIYIPNALPGEYYIVVITNYSNQPCNIIFTQTNMGQAGSGVTNCSGLATASGTFFYDENQNNIYDATESPLFGAMVYSPSCNIYFMSNVLGEYGSYVCAVPDSIIPYYNHPHILSVSPTGYYIYGAVTQADFAVTIEEVNDLSVDLVNQTAFVPGFTCGMHISVLNEGVLSNGGLLAMQFDPAFTYSYATPMPDSVSGNTIYWQTQLIGMLDYFNATAYFDVDSSLQMGMQYSFGGEVISDLPDTNLLNNVAILNDSLVASYDPNDKQVTPEGMITNTYAATSPEFEYIVRFQNTGTYMATNIKITDTLSNLLNVPSFKLISSSHPCTYVINGSGIVEFTFQNINLPDSNANEPESHGFVKFSVKCKPELEFGGNVYNTAYIYFDYNPAIVTNTVLTYTKLSVPVISIEPKEKTKDIEVYPNPATNNISVSFNETMKGATIEISDVTGKIVMSVPIAAKQKQLQLNISHLNKGFYNVTLHNGNRTSVDYLIIE